MGAITAEEASVQFGPFGLLWALLGSTIMIGIIHFVELVEYVLKRNF